MTSDPKIHLSTLLDGLGQAVLIFANDGRLLADNLAARTLFGTDINLIRSSGWQAASALFNVHHTDSDAMIDAVRSRALKSERPVRFHIFRSGEYIPCWASAVLGTDGELCTMITIDVPDWHAMESLLAKFTDEINNVLHATRGHVDLIGQTIDYYDPELGVELLARRVTSFTRLISTHMYRASRLMDMLDRMQQIRTGQARRILREQRRKIMLSDFMEDFLEELDEIELVDPETEARDHRSRMTVSIPDDLAVNAAPRCLTHILHDLLRNAIMYSMKATPIRIMARAKQNLVQIDVKDQGYGIREKEREHVFEAFQRAHQPQIISEFGYGLSLHLCKHEVEAMNGRMWFDSEEGVGTTFSFMLPLWREESASVSSSDSETMAP